MPLSWLIILFCETFVPKWKRWSKKPSDLFLCANCCRPSPTKVPSSSKNKFLGALGAQEYPPAEAPHWFSLLAVPFWTGSLLTLLLMLAVLRARLFPARRDQAEGIKEEAKGKERETFSRAKKDCSPLHAETTHKDRGEMKPLSVFHLADPFAQGSLAPFRSRSRDPPPMRARASPRMKSRRKNRGNGGRRKAETFQQGTKT